MTEKAEPTLTFSYVGEWDAWLAKLGAMGLL